MKIKIKEILAMPFMVVPYLAYRTSSYRDRLKKDVDRFWSVHYGCKPSNYFIGIVRELVNCVEFRNLFFYRCGRIGRALSHVSLCFFKKQQLLSFGVSRDEFGGGCFIQHGYCTCITAESIGENLWINQNVTLAFDGDKRPIIGDNVHIGTDANIFGGIRVGDNVTIGGGCTVVRDVPDNTLVVSAKPRYIDKFTRTEK